LIIKSFPHKLLIEISARILPSESESKVKTAIKNIVFPVELCIEENDTYLIKGHSTDSRSLVPVLTSIKARQSTHIARRLLHKNKIGNSTTLDFNKQAAYVGVAAICESPDESPLGSILLKISTNEIDIFIDWFAPFTHRTKT
jgi:predicted RNA binding protein with dsRBD fold (UPF0201 family)